MSFWDFANWRIKDVRQNNHTEIKDNKRNRYDRSTCGDLELIMIAKKLEMAASLGDYGMMNQLNQEFRRVKNDRLRTALKRAEAIQAEAELVA